MIWAIVLAGSSNEGSLKVCSNAANEALIKIGDKVMIEYVVDALENAQQISKIVIVGPQAELQQIYQNNAKIIMVDSGSTIIDSVQKGIEAITEPHIEKVLIVTSDIPLITGEIIDDFITQGLKKQADIIYPIVSKDHNDKKFPGVKRTYVKLKDGVFTGGNTFLVNPKIVPACADMAEEIVKLRKKPLKLIGFIGISYIFKYFIGSLAVLDAEERVSRILKIQAKSMVVIHPEIGVDVDKPSDLELVKKVLKNQWN